MLLEVIALDISDAVAAEEGGAHRLEIVADMAADGLTPDPALVGLIRRETSLPLRPMLRANAGFRTDAAELARLRKAAEALAEAGADGFVFGFLDGPHVDVAATAALAEAVSPLPWTFHRAVDHVPDGWNEIQDLPGLDQVLTSGSPKGVEHGTGTLLRRAAEGGSRLIMAGGGLRRTHVPVLKAGGIEAFHVGSAVRDQGSWEAPIRADLVREWIAQIT